MDGDLRHFQCYAPGHLHQEWSQTTQVEEEQMHHSQLDQLYISLLWHKAILF